MGSDVFLPKLASGSSISAMDLMDDDDDDALVILNNYQISASPNVCLDRH